MKICDLLKSPIIETQKLPLRNRCSGVLPVNALLLITILYLSCYSDVTSSFCNCWVVKNIESGEVVNGNTFFPWIKKLVKRIEHISWLNCVHLYNTSLF